MKARYLAPARRSPHRITGAAWLALALALVPAARAADPAPPPAGALKSVADATASDSSDADEEDEAPKPAPRRKKRNFRRSRLTRDETNDTADHRNILLTTGEARTVDLDFKPYQDPNHTEVGNPKIVGITYVNLGDSRQQLVFTPLGSGETTVTLRDDSGQVRLIFYVRVTGSNLLRIAGEVRDLVRDIEGVDIRIVGPKIIIEGEVLVPADYGRIFMVVSDKAYSDFVMNLTTLSPLAMQVLARKIQDDVHAFAPSVTTRVVNGTIFLEGTVDVAYKASRAVNIAAIYLPEVRPQTLIERDTNALHGAARRLVQNFIIVDPPPPKKQEKLVRVTVHFVELSKDYSKLFAFKWAPGFTPGSDQLQLGQSATGAAATTAPSLTATIQGLLPSLNAAQTAGFARVLKTGTFVVRSSQEAKLNESTTYPTTVQGPNGTIVSGQPATVKFEVTARPTILGQSEDIQLDMDMEQDNVVGKVTNGSAPITSVHRVKTMLYVKSNESAAVAAVNSTDVGTAFNKDDPNPGGFAAADAAAGAGAGATPTTSPLFNLLHSKNYQKKKSQFVIFVTPQIIESASEGTEDLRKNFRVKVK